MSRVDGALAPSPATEGSEARWLAWLVIGLGAALVMALGVTNAAPRQPGADQDAAALLLGLVNDARSEQHLAPLDPAPDVAAVAEAWSSRMAETGVLEHNPRYARQFCCWTSATENVAFSEPHRFWRPGDPVDRITRELHERLLASPGHRENLLDPNVDQVGIGVHVGDDGSIWITQNFRRYVPE